jgi:F-type H+-transporting ATPase subunit gamma
MANTREIRRRIKSIKNTSQITKAMQMVASSKMRRAQQAAMAGRPYAELLNEMLRSGSGIASLSSHPLTEERSTTGKECVIVISTNKGLCGALNTNLLRMVTELDPKKSNFITAGRKGRQHLARIQRDLVADFEIGDKLRFSDARRMARKAMDLFLSGSVDRVRLAFSNFVNTMTQVPHIELLLPLSHDIRVQTDGIGGASATARTAHEHEKLSVTEYLFEPAAGEVLGELLPHAVEYQVWHAMLEAQASEHSARMLAMKNATDNANQLVKDLTLEYNKARQASITNEILELSSAAAALQ